jgi:hypothetical protein
MARALRANTARPMFVLDRARLVDYVDDSERFDNRYLAKLPSAASLKQLGISRVFYVTDKLPEADDVNDDLLAYQAAGVAPQLVLTKAFVGAPPSYLGTSPTEAQHAFAAAYDGVAHPDWRMVSTFDPAAAWTPAPRPSLYASGPPPGFGEVPVMLAAGAVIGARMFRSGSWNRSSSSSWGGG